LRESAGILGYSLGLGVNNYGFFYSHLFSIFGGKKGYWDYWANLKLRVLKVAWFWVLIGVRELRLIGCSQVTTGFIQGPIWVLFGVIAGSLYFLNYMDASNT